MLCVHSGCVCFMAGFSFWINLVWDVHKNRRNQDGCKYFCTALCDYITLIFFLCNLVFYVFLFCLILGEAQYSTEIITEEASTQWKNKRRVWENSSTHQGEETESRVIFITAIDHYILGVAQYTDVTIRYVPRFGGHGSIRFRYNRKKKKSTMLGYFSFILNRQ